MEWTYCLSIGFFQAVITAIVWFCASYIKEKGKNLATREDIHAITRQIESAKIQYAKELESIKSQLNTKFHAQTMRFEKEFTVFTEIWKTLPD
jgi:cell division protein FtsL